MNFYSTKTKRCWLVFSFLTVCFFLAAYSQAAGPAPKKPQMKAEPQPDANVAEQKTTPQIEAKATEEPNTPPEQIQDSNNIAITVNGVSISESEIETLLKPQLDKMGDQLPPAFVDQYKSRLRQQLLEKLIVERLLGEKVKAANITITEEDIMAHLKESGTQQQPPLSVEDIKALIEARGQSFDEAKQRIKQGLGYKKLMEDQWQGKINITEEDANNYYSENAEQLEQVRASHILITPDTSDPNADPNQAKEKAKAKAQELLKQIRDGADFALLAENNSGCPSSARGGDLGFFSRGQMVPAFEETAFGSKVGQVSDIVETKFGYHIIKVADRKDTFEQFRDDIINILTQNKQNELAVQYVESLKAQADIVYPPGKEPATANAVPTPPEQTSAQPQQDTSSEGKTEVE